MFQQHMLLALQERADKKSFLINQNAKKKSENKF